MRNTKQNRRNCWLGFVSLWAAVLLGQTSCTVAKGNRNSGEWAYTSLGGNFTGQLDPDGMVGEVDNSTSATKAMEIAGKIVGYIELSKAVRSVATDARKAYETNRDLKLDRAKVDANENVKLRELDVKETIATETIASE